MQGMTFVRVFAGVATVVAFGAAGYMVGEKFKHPQIGAAVGIAAGAGVNYAMMLNGVHLEQSAASGAHRDNT